MKKSALLLAACLLSALPAAAETAFAQLLAAAPVASADARARMPRTVSAAPAALAVAPGKDLAPRFSDPGRVALILKIVAAVYDGTPLPFPKDGIVFQNKEGRLPAQAAGYYHEYTVLPPEGSPSTITVGDRTFRISPPQGHRGAERLIIGGGELLYYSPDHYKTFIPLTVLR